MRSDFLELLSLWALYCVVHSVLISIRATNFFKRILGTGYCYYRLFFNIFSFCVLVLLLLYSRLPRFQGPVLFTWNGNWRIVKYALILMAVALIISGARHYSMSQFLGLRQIRKRLSANSLSESGDLDAGGVLGLVRHPWYVAVFILLWTSNLTVGAFTIKIVLSAYLVIGTLLEERKLVLAFGDKYREYQKNVSMFIPLKFLKRNKGKGINNA
jgi:methanethiol S-methyltransferase